MIVPCEFGSGALIGITLFEAGKMLMHYPDELVKSWLYTEMDWILAFTI